MEWRRPLRSSWKSGYAQAASDAADPDLVIDFDGHRTQPEELVALLIHPLLLLQRVWIDRGDTRGRQFTVVGVGATSDMTGHHDVAIVPPANVVDVESDRGGINSNRGLSPRETNERLVAPSANVEPSTVGRRDQAIGPSHLAAGHLGPPGLRMPLPQLTALRIEIGRAEGTVG